MAGVSAPAEVPTAPGLLKLESRRALLFVAAAIVALVVSVFGDLRGVDSVPLLVVSVVLASLAMLLMVRVWPDPMPLWAAIAVVGLVVSGCVLSCAGVRHVPVNAGQTNALAAGIAVLAFMCVRGRIMLVWFGFALTVAVFGMWGVATGQGLLPGVLYAAPNVGVLGMSTLFAAIMRPAAADIARLRQIAVAESADIAATTARAEERRAQQETLRAVARPAMEAVVGGAMFSDADAMATRLVGAQLRDSIRAPSLNVPAVVAAAAAARGRGVKVVLLDDGGLDEASAEVRQAFCDVVADQLRAAADGSITVRIAPPGRTLAGSIVVRPTTGISQRTAVDADGHLHQGLAADSL